MKYLAIIAMLCLALLAGIVIGAVIGLEVLAGDSDEERTNVT